MQVPLAAALAKGPLPSQANKENTHCRQMKTKTKQNRNQGQGHERRAGSSCGKILRGDTEADKEPDPEESSLHMTKWAHVHLCTQENSCAELARSFSADQVESESHSCTPSPSFSWSSSTLSIISKSPRAKTMQTLTSERPLFEMAGWVAC